MGINNHFIPLEVTWALEELVTMVCTQTAQEELQDTSTSVFLDQIISTIIQHARLF